jgi:hypothetical protein
MDFLFQWLIVQTDARVVFCSKETAQHLSCTELSILYLCARYSVNISNTNLRPHFDGGGARDSTLPTAW